MLAHARFDLGSLEEEVVEEEEEEELVAEEEFRRGTVVSLEE